MQQFTGEQISVRTDMRVSVTLQALRRIARSVSGYPGRKNLIWLSEAFPLVVVTEDKSGIASNYIGSMRETANVLTDAEVAIYPVDVRGLVNTDMPDIALDGQTSNPAQLATEAARRSAALRSFHDSMDILAQQTGGRAFYNRNDIDGAITEGVNDGTAYYTLGYYPTAQNWNGRFRTIEVKVRRTGVSVRSRKGYYAVDLDSTRTEDDSFRQEFLSALIPDAPKMTALPFEVRVSPSVAESGVEVEYRVNPRGLVFRKQADNNQHADLEFVVRAFSSQAEHVASESKRLQVNLKSDRYNQLMQSSGLSFTERVKLPKGEYILEIGVLDAISKLTGSISARVTCYKRS